jgi:hypothetical protein
MGSDRILSILYISMQMSREENRVPRLASCGSVILVLPFHPSLLQQQSRRPNSPRGLLLEEYRGKGSGHDYEHAHGEREEHLSSTTRN